MIEIGNPGDICEVTQQTQLTYLSNGTQENLLVRENQGTRSLLSNICVLLRYRTDSFIIQALATHVFNCGAISSLFAFISKYPSESTSRHNKEPSALQYVLKNPLSTIYVQTLNNCSFIITSAVAKLRDYLVVVKLSFQKTLT